MDKKDERKSQLLLEINLEELFSKRECRYAIFALHKLLNEICWTDPTKSTIFVLGYYTTLERSRKHDQQGQKEFHLVQ